MGADIDIALDNGKKIDSKKLMYIKDQIEESTIPLHIDVVDLATTSEKLKKEIEKEGVLWKN